MERGSIARNAESVGGGEEMGTGGGGRCREGKLILEGGGGNHIVHLPNLICEVLEALLLQHENLGELACHHRSPSHV
jgi:hypothetical protein